MLIAVAYRGPGVAPDPVPQALVLTGIVVAVSATALALALARRLTAEQIMTDMLIWLVAIPLTGAVATLLLPRQATALVYVTAVATTAVAGMLLYQVGTRAQLTYEIGGWTAGLGIALRADGLSTMLLMMTALVVMASQCLCQHLFQAKPTSAHASGPCGCCCGHH